MRHESCVTSLSWIPSEAIEGSTRLAFDAGIAHYDDPPPDVLGDVEALRAADRFRFANVLRAWIEVDAAGTVTGAGYDGGGLIGATTVRLGALRHTFQAAQLPLLQRPPSTGTAGSGSSRPPAAGPGCRPRAGSGTRRSSSGRRRWSGPRSR